MSTVAAPSGVVQELVERMRGPVLQPDDAGFDEARRIWNGMIDRRPTAIARCTGAADVAAAVRFAREKGMPLSVRGGGHNVSGRSVCEGGVLIDLSGVRNVRVDRERGVARVGGGALLGDIDHETQAVGMAVPVGAVSETGIGGLALHGGYGFLSRKYGLTADQLVAADLVTADGTILTVDERTHPDLFWALKGGGGGFGVVTSFEFRMHPVGPEVYFLLVLYPAAEGRGVLETFRSVMPEAPDELTALAIYWNAPEEEPIPQEHRGAPVMALVGCWCGTLDEGERVTRPLREIATPIADLSGPTPYLAAQRLFDPEYPKGRRYYWKSHYVRELSDDVIELVLDAGGERPTPISTVEVWGLGGALARVPSDATPFYHRDAPFLLAIEANALDPATDEANIEWVRRRHADARRLSDGGSYLNFGGFLEGGEQLLAEAFGPNYERLRRIKATYDPDGLFGSGLGDPAAGSPPAP
jgi:FAD/FMN-containing dehydrogenase